MREFYSMAYITPTALVKSFEEYKQRFMYALGGAPIRYSWRFIAKGDFWFYDMGTNTPIYAERDYVELLAFREGS